MQHCPQCKERAVKIAPDGETTLYVRKILISKSDGTIILICSNCRSPFSPDNDLLKVMSNALLLTKSKNGQGPPTKVEHGNLRQAKV